MLKQRVPLVFIGVAIAALLLPLIEDMPTFGCSILFRPRYLGFIAARGPCCL